VIGPREDDYAATESSFHDRGRTFDRQLVELRAVWAWEDRGIDRRSRPALAHHPS
jgi:hypothetical protein